jgi:hypothetical protein
MYSLTLDSPFVDADRRNPSGGGGDRISTRARFAVAFVVLAVVWQLVRLLVHAS